MVTTSSEPPEDPLEEEEGLEEIGFVMGVERKDILTGIVLPMGVVMGEILTVGVIVIGSMGEILTVGGIVIGGITGSVIGESIGSARGTIIGGEMEIGREIGRGRGTGLIKWGSDMRERVSGEIFNTFCFY